MRVAMGALGIGDTTPETSKNIFLQFWDEFTNPFGTDAAVLAQQTQPIGQNISQAASNVKGLAVIIGVGALVLGAVVLAKK
jgi:hypothetical protein